MICASRLSALAFAFILVLPALSARAQTTNQPAGFQLNRFEPSSPGSPFLWVEHPLYSSVRDLGASLSLQYAHDPLRYSETSLATGQVQNNRALIEHQLITHMDVAGAIKDRVLIGGALPVIWVERGQAAYGLSPLSAVAVSDPRFNIAVRAYGQPHRDRFSLHIAAAAWLPLRALNRNLPQQTSDTGFRGRLSLIAAGTSRAWLWSTSLGFEYRPLAELGNGLQPVGAGSGPEVHIAAAASYLIRPLQLRLGPEALFSTSMVPSAAFRPNQSSLEVLLSAQRHFAKLVQIGLGVGLGLLNEPGTANFRALLRVAYAPLSKDRDQDGIPDNVDACPDQKGVRSDVPSNHGCPIIPDRDCDGVPDVEDECPDQPEGRHPDPNRIGCPRTAGDRKESPRPSPPPSTYEREPAPAGYGN